MTNFLDKLIHKTDSSTKENTNKRQTSGNTQENVSSTRTVSTSTLQNAKRIKDSQGRLKTLSAGKFSFIKLHADSLLHSSTFEPQDFYSITKKKVLFLGLGYNAVKDAAPLCGGAEQIYYMESEDFEKACFDADVETTLPQNFTQASEKALFSIMGAEGNKLSDWEFVLYKQNMELFPKFWNELLISLQDFIDEKFPLYVNNDVKTTPSIFIAGSGQDLVHRELCEAVTALGYECITPLSVAGAIQGEQGPLFSNTPFSDKTILENEPSLSPDAISPETMILNLTKTLKSKKPDFFLSINGRNLDSNGKMASTLQQLKIPLVIWILDNPWNILSAFKQDWWKECILYVTDESFVSLLRDYGAQKVSHLPLAASTHSMHINVEVPRTNLLFVGNSSFPDKEKFFGAVSKHLDTPLVVCKNLINKYYNSLQLNGVSKSSIKNQDNAQKNAQTDAKINIQNLQESPEQETEKVELLTFQKIYSYLYPSKQQALWPGNEFRFVSFLAAECDTYQKIHWLNTLSNTKVIGDKAWKKLLKNPNRVFAPVDYYTQLPSHYATSNFTLNITSPLMPGSLTQRHFDVWLSGGFLLTTPTQGLSIFNSEIAALTTVTSPEKAFETMGKFAKKPSIYNEIKRAMVNNIVTNHFYSHRILHILNHL